MNIKRMNSLFLGIALAGICFAGQKSPSGFSRIVSELDVGGEYLEVLDAASFQSDINGGLDFLEALVREFKVFKNEKDFRTAHDVRTAVASTGFLSLRGLGSSVMKVNDSSYRHRSFLLTEKGKVPFLDLFAGGMRPWTVESYLPRSTAYAASFSMDMKGCALHASEALKKLQPAVSMMIRAMCTSQSGTDSVLDGFAPGTLFAFTLDASQPWKVPEANVLAPMPGILVVQAVKGSNPWGMIKTAVLSQAQSGQFACSALPGPKFPDMERLVVVVPEPEQKGLKISPACAYDAKNGVIVAASSVELLDAALEAGVKKQGRLLDDATFRASATLPNEISGFVYLSPKTVPVLADVARQVLMKQKAPSSPTLMAWLDKPKAFWTTGAFIRQADGVKCEAYSNIGSCNTLRLLMSCGLPQIGAACASAASNGAF